MFLQYVYGGGPRWSTTGVPPPREPSRRVGFRVHRSSRGLTLGPDCLRGRVRELTLGPHRLPVHLSVTQGTVHLLTHTFNTQHIISITQTRSFIFVRLGYVHLGYHLLLDSNFTLDVYDNLLVTNKFGIFGRQYLKI